MVPGAIRIPTIIQTFYKCFTYFLSSWIANRLTSAFLIMLFEKFFVQLLLAVIFTFKHPIVVNRVSNNVIDTYCHGNRSCHQCTSRARLHPSIKRNCRICCASCGSNFPYLICTTNLNIACIWHSRHIWIGIEIILSAAADCIHFNHCLSKLPILWFLKGSLIKLTPGPHHLLATIARTISLYLAIYW